MRFGRLLSLITAIIAITTLGPGLNAGVRDGGALFSSYSRVDFSLKAPLQELFAVAQEDDDYAVAATVTYTDGSGRTISIDGVEVSVRGRTSKRESECSFPKLKLRFKDPDAAASSIFSGIKAVKIGTHCGERPDGDLTERFGRWANEKEPLREAFVYRLLNTLQVRSFKARPARITYIDESERPLVRNAMLLEDDREAMARLGGTREIDPADFKSADRQFAPEDTAKLAFAEAMLGNFDWCLKFTADDTYRCDARRPLWNIVAFAADNGPAIPLLYDFDVAGIIVGRHTWFSNLFYGGFLESGSAPAVEVLSQVQHTRALFPRALLDSTRRHFVERKAEGFRALEQSEIDAGGRSIASTYLNAFYRDIESDDAFYAPVVVRGTTIYRDADKTTPACGEHSTAPPGTLVGRTLETAGDMIKVPVLDVQWRWAPPIKCDAVHRGPVWLDRSAVGTDYPPR